MQSKCEGATQKVRDHIKSYKEQASKVKKQYDEIDERIRKVQVGDEP